MHIAKQTKFQRLIFLKAKQSIQFLCYENTFYTIATTTFHRLRLLSLDSSSPLSLAEPLLLEALLEAFFEFLII